MHLVYARPVRTPQETAHVVLGTEATTAQALTCGRARGMLTCHTFYDVLLFKYIARPVTQTL